MNFFFRILFCFLAILSALSSRGGDFYPITEADKKFLSQVVDAASRKDTAWIASHMNYPLYVFSEKGKRLVRNKDEFVPVLKRELTDKIAARIAAEAKKPLFKNWQGVMVGDGLVWLTELQSDEDSHPRYAILAIGLFAFQQEFSPHS